MTTTPRPGDFATVATPGWAGSLIRAVTRSPVNHAIGYVGDGMIVEAQPAGAQLVSLTAYDGYDLHWSTDALPVTDELGLLIADAYRARIGTPYSWADDVAIGLVRLFGLDWTDRTRLLVNRAAEWARNRTVSKAYLECAQLVDVANATAGRHLFTDGRLPGNVAPGDLYDLTAGKTP